MKRRDRASRSIIAAVIALTGFGLSGCESEVDKCKTQLNAVLANFYQGDRQALAVEHFASFDRLPQHDAPACVTEVLHDPSIDAKSAADFDLIAPLWRGARADVLAAQDPDIDGDGIVRASPSDDFYSRACSMGHEGSCARAELAKSVLACSRAKPRACEKAAKTLDQSPAPPYPQAFASRLVLQAKGCLHGCESCCEQVKADPNAGSLEASFGSDLCARVSLSFCPPQATP